MKAYPLGIQTFDKIIDKGLLYIDKTKSIYQLTQFGGYYFYARPRRFGKSLMLSTLTALYEGKKDLFQGLWIADQWDWSKKHPVIHFGFNAMGHGLVGLAEAIHQELNKLAQQYNISFQGKDYARKFRELIEGIAQKQGKVVILIDEHDKPIIDYLGKDLEQAKQNRDTLKMFYSIIKHCDPYIELMMITGVSKFSKVSIFSELNNLTDISFHPRYLSLTGISQQELETNFATEIETLAAAKKVSTQALLHKIRRWYNGYSWDGSHFFYNPYSLLSYFDFGVFRNYWFETGTPSFLLEIMKEQKMFKINQLKVDSSIFSAYNIEKLEAVPLLFQTGYLTIKAQENENEEVYVIDYPNLEVRDSMMRSLIGELRYKQGSFSRPMVTQVRDALVNKELEQLIRLIKSIFKNIPYPIFKAEGEFYYHSLIYLVFFYLGDFIESEVNTNDGRLDAVIKTDLYIYILEFKFNKNAQTALEQIKTKGYAEKYYGDARQKILLGINFSSELKTVDDWKFEIC